MNFETRGNQSGIKRSFEESAILIAEITKTCLLLDVK